MIKEVLSMRNVRYYKANDGIFHIFVWEDENDLTEEKIENAWNNAKLPSCVTDATMEELKNKPLAIFELKIRGNDSYIEPMNMSLYEYEYFIKGNEKPELALKSAFITKDAGMLCIMCEPYDYESALTRENKNKINSAVIKDKEELYNITETDDYYIEFLE
jgi:hypothetical protein